MLASKLGFESLSPSFLVAVLEKLARDSIFASLRFNVWWWGGCGPAFCGMSTLLPLALGLPDFELPVRLPDF